MDRPGLGLPWSMALCWYLLMPPTWGNNKWGITTELCEGAIAPRAGIYGNSELATTSVQYGVGRTGDTENGVLLVETWICRCRCCEG